MRAVGGVRLATFVLGFIVLYQLLSVEHHGSPVGTNDPTGAVTSAGSDTRNESDVGSGGSAPLPARPAVKTSSIVYICLGLALCWGLACLYIQSLRQPSGQAVGGTNARARSQIAISRLAARLQLPVSSVQLLASDRDFDSNDYEALLALDNDMPTNQLRAASQTEVNRLPVVSYRPNPKAVAAGATAGPACCVCLEAFEPGEDLRVLPCFHQFHVICIDKWLGIRAECPVCKVSVRAEELDPEFTVVEL